MRIAATVFLAAVLAHFPLEGFAQEALLVDNGGRLGVTLDVQSYTVGNVIALKIIGISDTSPLNGILGIGDYIYRVNNTNVQKLQDIVNAIAILRPQSKVDIYWLNHDNNFKSMKLETFTLTANPVPITQPLSCAPYMNLTPYTGDTINNRRGACDVVADAERKYAIYRYLALREMPGADERYQNNLRRIHDSRTMDEFDSRVRAFAADVSATAQRLLR